MQLLSVQAFRYSLIWCALGASVCFSCSHCFFILACSLLWPTPPAKAGNSKKKHAYFRPFIYKSMTNIIWSGIVVTLGSVECREHLDLCLDTVLPCIIGGVV